MSANHDWSKKPASPKSAPKAEMISALRPQIGRLDTLALTSKPDIHVLTWRAASDSMLHRRKCLFRKLRVFVSKTMKDLGALGER